MTFLLLYFFFRKDQWIVLLGHFIFRSLILISMVLQKKDKIEFKPCQKWILPSNRKNDISRLIAKKVHIVTFNTLCFCSLIHPFTYGHWWLWKKITYPYAFTFLKMKHAEGINEYIDLAQEANLLCHQIVSQKAKTRS